MLVGRGAPEQHHQQRPPIPPALGFMGKLREHAMSDTKKATMGEEAESCVTCVLHTCATMYVTRCDMAWCIECVYACMDI